MRETDLRSMGASRKNSRREIESREQYQLSTGVWVIAECERCGRGFIYVNLERRKPFDGFLPERSSAAAPKDEPCYGLIRFYRYNPKNPERDPRATSPEVEAQAVSTQMSETP